MSPIYRALFFGPFRVVTGEKEIPYSFEKDTITLRELLDRIVSQFPDLKEYLFQGDEISESTSIIVNGEDIRGEGGLDAVLHPSDRITFFKAAGGG